MARSAGRHRSPAEWRRMASAEWLWRIAQRLRMQFKVLPLPQQFTL